MLNYVWVYLIVGLVFIFVLLQSLVFLIKAYKKGVALGFTKEEA